MKNIVVVGGSGGLGSAVVTALLNRNYQVVVAGRKPASDPRVAEFHPINTATADWPAVYCKIEASTGAPIDAVIFVSGTAAYGKAAQVPAQSAREILELNFWSCIGAAQAAGEYWSASHRPGKFLAVLSITAKVGVAFEAHYSASKAATARFLECLDLEYGGDQIRFLSAFPGMLNTQFRSHAPWYGLSPSRLEGGADPVQTAQAMVALLEGSRHAPVIGWRERAIDLAERVWPGLYNRTVQFARVKRVLAGASAGQRKLHEMNRSKVPSQADSRKELVLKQAVGGKMTLSEKPAAEPAEKTYSI